VIKRVAFGFRTFRHLRMRILIQQNLCDIIWAKKQKEKRKRRSISFQWFNENNTIW
jgi:transposase